jgi:hypothetical protein
MPKYQVENKCEVLANMAGCDAGHRPDAVQPLLAAGNDAARPVWEPKITIIFEFSS